LSSGADSNTAGNEELGEPWDSPLGDKLRAIVGDQAAKTAFSIATKEVEAALVHSLKGYTCTPTAGGQGGRKPSSGAEGGDLSDLPFNMTHGTEQPVNNWPAIQKRVALEVKNAPKKKRKKYERYMAKMKGCLTLTADEGDSAKDLHKLTRFCTSCKPGYALRMFNHKSRAGFCRDLSSEVDGNGNYRLGNPEPYCTRLDRDSTVASPVERDILCTKMGFVTNVLQLRKMTGGMKEAFGSFIKDPKAPKYYNRVAVGICQVWKVTACRKGGTCTVRKNAACVKVCKQKRWPQAHDPPEAIIGGDCESLKNQTKAAANYAKGPVMKLIKEGKPQNKKKDFKSDARLAKKVWSTIQEGVARQHKKCNYKPECTEELCEGEYGDAVCRQVAMML
jgi:hypothetical protein